MPDYYEQPDYLKDLYNSAGGTPPTNNGTNPTPTVAGQQPQGSTGLPVAQGQIAQPQPQVNPMGVPPVQPQATQPIQNQPIAQQGVAPQPLSPVENPFSTTYSYPQENTSTQITPTDPLDFQSTTTTTTTQNTKTVTTRKPIERRRLFTILAIILGIILLLLVIFLLLNRNRTTETPRENIVLQWWGSFLEPEVVQPLLDEYKAANPNVTIEYANRFRSTEPYIEEVQRYKDELNRVLVEANQVEIPDIFMVDANWVGDYEKYARVSNSYTSETFRNTFHDFVSTNFVKGTQVYGAPLWVDNFSVIYNKDLLAQASLTTPPETWAAFKILAQNLTRVTNNTMTQAGFAGGTSLNTSYSADLLQILMLQNGVELATAAGVPTFADDVDSLSAVQFYQSFLTDSKPTWSSTNFTNDSAAFLEGKVAMIIVPSYRYREILRYNEQYEIGLDIGVAKLPQVEGSEEQYNLSDYWGNMVAINRPNSTESWKFLNWITQSEQLKKLSDNVKEYNGYFGLLYPRKDMEQELIGDEFLRVYNEQLGDTKSWYMIKGLEIDAEFQQLLNSNNLVNQNRLNQLQEEIIEIRATQGQF